MMRSYSIFNSTKPDPPSFDSCEAEAVVVSSSISSSVVVVNPPALTTSEQEGDEVIAKVVDPTLNPFVAGVKSTATVNATLQGADDVTGATSTATGNASLQGANDNVSNTEEIDDWSIAMSVAKSKSIEGKEDSSKDDVASAGKRESSFSKIKHQIKKLGFRKIGVQVNNEKTVPLSAERTRCKFKSKVSRKHQEKDKKVARYKVDIDEVVDKKVAGEEAWQFADDLSLMTQSPDNDAHLLFSNHRENPWMFEAESGKPDDSVIEIQEKFGSGKGKYRCIAKEAMDDKNDD
jgi:hypothetical protein